MNELQQRSRGNDMWVKYMPFVYEGYPKFLILNVNFFYGLNNINNILDCLPIINYNVNVKI